jgi:hypothetical protein
MRKFLSIGYLIGLCVLGRADAAWADAVPTRSLSPQQQIIRLLEDQVTAWNQGDIEGFMRGYWNSPDLVFTSAGEVRRGWQTTLERYRASYPDHDRMGELSFSDLEIHLFPAPSDRGGTPLVAWVLGKWRLKRASDNPHGIFTLILQRFPNLPGHLNEQWRIVHDHTSASSPDPK